MIYQIYSLPNELDLSFNLPVEHLSAYNRYRRLENPECHQPITQNIFFATTVLLHLNLFVAFEKFVKPTNVTVRIPEVLMK